jgi:hypothetical protein
VEGVPPPSDPAATGGPGSGECPRCGTPYDAGQEYCLECGLALQGSARATRALAGAWRRRIPWYPGDWVWAALLGLAVAAVAATVVILADRGNADGNRLVATDNRTVGTSADTGTVTETTPPETAPTTTQTKTTTPTTTASPTNQVRAWPAGRSGYTVVLNSIPTTAGRARAVDEARRAIRAGLQDVGVLDSSQFSTLHPGYYVVFSGFYPGSAAATNAVAAARDAGFGTPYPRQIAR